jgi:hypothetical protein
MNPKNIIYANVVLKLMKKVIGSVAIIFLTLVAVLSGCVSTESVDVDLCVLSEDHTPYIGQVVRTTGYLENTDSQTRWQLMGMSGAETCRVAFDYDFGNDNPPYGQTITVTGVVQQDKVQVYSWLVPILDECYIES